MIRDERFPQTNAQVITFYSYKGGTGRSMALANVAWILASRGHQVLAIDWDLEAPGLHRYFAPFLADPTLRDAQGLIDQLYNYEIAAGKPPPDGQRGTAWIGEYAAPQRYTEPLQWSFPEGGRIDLLCAGCQDARYAERVNRFNWLQFYERFGGAAFFDAMMAAARNDYDYVLIDSRTGVSDTSGICTVQMPDALAVFYTLNDQSIEGASAVAMDALRQRRALDDDLQFNVYPIATRIELAEQDKLAHRRQLARQRFEPATDFLTEAAELDAYFGDMEVLYVPYYAYEETLATIVDKPGARNTLLASFELITGYLTGGRVSSLGEVSEIRREEAKTTYVMPPQPVTPAAAPRRRYDVFVTCHSHERKAAGRIVEKLAPYCEVFYGPDSVTVGHSWQDAVSEALSGSRVVLVLVSDAIRGESNVGYKAEVVQAVQAGKRLVPVYASAALRNDLAGDPELGELTSKHGLVVPGLRDAQTVADAVLKTLGVATGSRSSQSAGGGPTKAMPTAALPSMRWMAAAVAAVLAVIALFVWVPRGNRSDLQAEALAAQLTTASLEVAAGDPVLSLLLAREAVQLVPADSALRALRAAISNSPEIRRFTLGDGESVEEALLSPDGSALLARTSSGSVFVGDVDAPLERLPGNTAAIAWRTATRSGGATALMVGAGGAVSRWSPNSGLSQAFVVPAGAGGFSFSPDGRSLVRLDSKRGLQLWSVVEEQSLATVDSVLELPRNPWSASSGAFAAVTQRSTVGVFRADGSPWYQWQGNPEDLLLNTEGDAMAVLAGPASVLCAFDGKQTRIRPLADDGEPTAVAFGRNGAVAVGFASGRIQLRNLADPNVQLEIPATFPAAQAPPVSTPRATNTRQLPLPDSAAGSAIRLLRFAPEGRRFLAVTAANRLFVATSNFSEPLLTMAGHQRPINNAGWSEDGRLLVSASQDGTVRIWDPDTSLVPVDISAAQLLELAQRRSPVQLTPEQRRLYGLNEDAAGSY